jgi:sarcosine oxidase gamma subunit
VFQPGACGQTVAAKSNILFYGPAAGGVSVEHVRLYTRRSFSQYLFARLEDAALEYGLSFTAL